MSLKKVTYVDDDNAIYAENLNDIQDEIINVANAVGILSEDVSELDERVIAIEEARKKL